MKKAEYRAARRLLRENGITAMRWLTGRAWHAMDRLMRGQKYDRLQRRSDVVAWCRREGIAYNFHQIQ